MLHTDITVRPPHASDICRLLRGLRQADRAEIAAAGCDPRTIIEQSVHDSPFCWAALADGELILLFGVAPMRGQPGTGIPWAMGTDLVQTHRRTLMRRVPAYIALMLRAYPRLVNFVHAENDRSIHWLRHMGFTLEPAAPHGPHLAMFRRFEMRANGPD